MSDDCTTASPRRVSLPVEGDDYIVGTLCTLLTITVIVIRKLFERRASTGHQKTLDAHQESSHNDKVDSLLSKHLADSECVAGLPERERAQIHRALSLLIKVPGVIRVHHGTIETFRDAFYGREFVDLVLEHQVVQTREEGIQLGVKLIHLDLAYHVVWKYDFEDSDRLAYRLCFHTEPDLTARTIERCMIPATQAAFMAGFGYYEAGRQFWDFPSTIYMFVMMGSFMLALLAVTTCQHILYYMRRLNQEMQRVAFHARANWLVEVVSHCFQISAVLYLTGLCLMPSNYYPESDIAYIPYSVALTSACAMVGMYCWLSYTYAEISLCSDAAIDIQVPSGQEKQADYVLALARLFNSKAMFIAGFCQAGIARYKSAEEHEEIAWSVIYLAGASVGVCAAVICGFVTTDVLYLATSIPCPRRRCWFLKRVVIAIQVALSCFFASLVALLVSFSAIAVGCSLECKDECGNPKPQGCYKDLRWIAFYSAIMGAGIIMFQGIVCMYAFLQARSTEEGAAVTKIDMELPTRLKARVQSLSSQATIAAGAVFYNLVTLNTDTINLCVFFGKFDWYHNTHCDEPAGISAGIHTFMWFNTFAFVFGVVAACLATAIEACDIYLDSDHKRLAFARAMRASHLRLDYWCTLYLGICIVCLFGSFAAFGYSKIVPTTYHTALSVGVGFVVMLYFAFPAIYAYRAAESYDADSEAGPLAAPSTDMPVVQLNPVSKLENEPAAVEAKPTAKSLDQTPKLQLYDVPDKLSTNDVDEELTTSNFVDEKPTTLERSGAAISPGSADAGVRSVFKSRVAKKAAAHAARDAPEKESSSMGGIGTGSSHGLNVAPKEMMVVASSEPERLQSLRNHDANTNILKIVGRFLGLGVLLSSSSPMKDVWETAELKLKRVALTEVEMESMITQTKAQLSILAPKSFLFGFYAYTAINFFLAPEVHPVGDLYVWACGLCFGLALAIVSFDTFFSFGLSGLESGYAKIAFGLYLQNKFNLVLYLFQVIIICFFASFGLVGYVKKDFMTYDFDNDHEWIAPIMIAGGCIGGLLCLWWSRKISKIYTIVRELPAEQLPPVCLLSCLYSGVSVHNKYEGLIPKEIGVLTQDTATIATLLTAGNLYYEILFARINMDDAPGETVFYYLMVTIGYVLGVTTVVAATMTAVAFKALEHNRSDPNWQARMLLFALHVKTSEATIYQMFNYSCFCWVASIFVHSRMKYYEANKDWVSAVWAGPTFLLMFFFWMCCRKYKHALDDKADYMPAELHAVPGLFQQENGVLSTSGHFASLLRNAQPSQATAAEFTSLRYEVTAAHTTILELRSELQEKDELLGKMGGLIGTRLKGKGNAVPSL